LLSPHLLLLPLDQLLSPPPLLLLSPEQLLCPALPLLVQLLGVLLSW